MQRISAIIEHTCKKLGIRYKSPYHDKILDYQADADKLAEMYLQLKEIAGSLVELEGKYPKLKRIIEIDIKQLDKIDHHLIIQANKIIRRKERRK